MKHAAPVLVLASLLATLAACTRDAAAPAADATATSNAAPTGARPADGATAGVPAKAGATNPPATPAAKPDHPALVVQTFDGKRWDLADHRGRWVVVNFWATWCAPCLEEIPDLARFDAAREDVDVIGLAYEEIERADMAAFLAKRPIAYPIAILDVYAPPPDFETPRGLPMTYLIAPDGRVAKTFLGPVTSTEIAKVIDATAPGAATGP